MTCHNAVVIVKLKEELVQNIREATPEEIWSELRLFQRTTDIGETENKFLFLLGQWTNSS